MLRKVFVAEGDLISKEGSAPVGLYFIRNGQVLLSRGWEVVSALGPGAVFGENVAVGARGPHSGDSHLMHTGGCFRAHSPPTLPARPRASNPISPFPSALTALVMVGYSKRFCARAVPL
jgi:hypothetical protein